MQISKLTDMFSVSGQVLPEDVSTAAESGYKTIICNRPDDEEFGQPAFRLIEEAASKLGIKVAHIPIIPGRAGMPEVMAFKDAVEASAGPVLAFCRTGARSAALFNAISSIR